MVRVTGFEPAASCSQSRRATNCATPGYSVFYPAGRILPNLSGILFSLVYSGFRRFLICFTYSLTLLSPLFPGVPAPSVVIYVVKNASRPVSGEDSPVPGGKRFVFQTVCIVTLSRVLCKWFSGRIAAQRLSRYRQRNTRMPYSLKIKLASPQ